MVPSNLARSRRGVSRSETPLLNATRLAKDRVCAKSYTTFRVLLHAYVRLVLHAHVRVALHALVRLALHAHVRLVLHAHVCLD
jgi:hypothetical protein